MGDERHTLDILVVDDSPLVLGMVAEALEEAGHQVRGTDSWVEANLMLQDQVPDLVLMDVQMPAIRGENFCRILKKSERYHQIPVVFFSSLEEDELRKLAEESGADGWIHKRLKPGLIREDLERTLRDLVRGGDESPPEA